MKLNIRFYGPVGVGWDRVWTIPIELRIPGDLLAHRSHSQMSSNNDQVNNTEHSGQLIQLAIGE